jgi:hypothetical protein
LAIARKVKKKSAEVGGKHIWCYSVKATSNSIVCFPHASQSHARGCQDVVSTEKFGKQATSTDDHSAKAAQEIQDAIMSSSQKFK